MILEEYDYGFSCVLHNCCDVNIRRPNNKGVPEIIRLSGLSCTNKSLRCADQAFSCVLLELAIPYQAHLHLEQRCFREMEPVVLFLYLFVLLFLNLDGVSFFLFYALQLLLPGRKSSLTDLRGQNFSVFSVSLP